MQTHTTHIAGKAGDLETDIDVPVSCTRGIAFLAHPLTTAGGSKDHKVITTMAKALTAAGWLVVRPNLRGAGRSGGNYEAGIGEADDFVTVIEAAFEMRGIVELLPADARVVFGGFSFGTYVTSLAAQVRKPAALILAAAAVNRYEMPVIGTPTFLIHGQNDRIVALEEVMAWADLCQRPVTVIPRADHMFTGKLKMLQLVFSQVCGLI